MKIIWYGNRMAIVKPQRIVEVSKIVTTYFKLIIGHRIELHKLYEYIFCSNNKVYFNMSISFATGPKVHCTVKIWKCIRDNSNSLVAHNSCTHDTQDNLKPI